MNNTRNGGVRSCPISDAFHVSFACRATRFVRFICTFPTALSQLVRSCGSLALLGVFSVSRAHLCSRAEPSRQRRRQRRERGDAVEPNLIGFGEVYFVSPAERLSQGEGRPGCRSPID